MSPPRWTTDEEYDFLKARLPQWLTNRSKGTLSAWSKQLFSQWTEEFGLPAATEEELEAVDGDVNAAMKAKRTEMRKVSDGIVPGFRLLTLHSVSAAGSTTIRRLAPLVAGGPRRW